jgi:hypothetical protein
VIGPTELTWIKTWTNLDILAEETSRLDSDQSDLTNMRFWVKFGPKFGSKTFSQPQDNQYLIDIMPVCHYAKSEKIVTFLDS